MSEDTVGYLAENVAPLSTGMMAGTALYTLLLGFGFVAFGMYVQHRWLAFWGSTMVMAGSAFLIALLAGWG
ncbi:MAG: hypothetical protein RQ736_01835 [Thiogranum sp.]|nr:hypothetical protein [Thiogranum sp.]